MENWKTVRLGDVCEILNGYAFKSDKYVDSGIRVIRITNVQKGFIEDNSPAFYPITEKENLKDYELYENDLLISLTGNVGRVALLSKEMLPAALNQRVGCIRIRDKNLLISYLFTFLNSDKFESDCIYSARGIAQKNMSTEWLKNYLIPLPPIEVQIKIANNLNTCAKIIKKHNKQLNNFDLLIKSRFIEMFGDPVINEKNWEKVRLDSVADIKIGPFGSLLHQEDYITGGHALVNPSHIIDGRICTDEKLTISDEKYTELTPYHLQKHDVVMGRRGEMGRCAVVDSDGLLCGTGSLIIRTKGELKSDFIQKIISFPSYKKTIEDKAVGQTMPNLNVPIVSSFEIIKPPKEIQDNYYAFVQQIDKSKFAVQKSLEKTEILYKSLMQTYFG